MRFFLVDEPSTETSLSTGQRHTMNLITQAHL